MEHMDIFTDDAFSLVSMVAAINEVDHVPGRAGELAFVGAGEGVTTYSVTIERQGTTLSLIKTTPRNAPAPKETQDKRTVRSVSIPQIKLEDTIGADQVAGVREFGTTDQLRTVQSVVNKQLVKMGQRHDLTLEYHRLGALKGKILDADASELTDLFALFGVTNDNSDVGGSATDVGPKIFDFSLVDWTESDDEDIRVKCQEVTRYIKRAAKMAIPSTALVWAFCGDGFFDKLISNPSVKEVFKNTAEQQLRLGANYAFGVFEFGGIVWENYQGTDDNATVAIGSEEARLFLTGAPGLYAEYFAPANFMETVNSIGLPRYAKLAPDTRFNQFVEVHTQQNPLPLCLRPQTLCKATSS